jgi:hypothetical protein
LEKLIVLEGGEMLKKLLVVLVLGVVLVVGLVLTQPEHYRVERSIEISASANHVFSTFEDLKDWPKWSPWAKRDANMIMEFSELSSGVGAYASWKSKTEGSGRQTVRAYEQDKKMNLDLEFYEPWTGVAKTDLTIVDAEDGKVSLTWGMDGNNEGFMGKFFYLIMDFDGLIGRDYEVGLEAIKKMAEQ